MKKLLIFLVLAALIGGAVGYFLWNKPHQNIAAAKADAVLDAATLFNEFSTDEAAANAKYNDKIISVSGKVKEFSKAADGAMKITLDTGGDAMFGVSCALDPTVAHARTAFAPGDPVTVKGKCDGFNLDVQLSRCVEVK